MINIFAKLGLRYDTLAGLLKLEIICAEVWFENFAALNNRKAYFKTEEGKDIGARVNAAAQIIERLQYTSVDY